MNPLSKPRLIFLLLAILATFLAHAQGGLGYILLKEGDTLRGDVRLKEGYPSAPRIVGFAGTESALPANFSANDCKSFRIGNDVYHSATVTMDMSYFSGLDDYKILNADSTLTRTIFLKEVYKGKHLTLLKYYNGAESGFFTKPNVKLHLFINDGENTRELIMKYTYAPDKGPFDFERGSRAMRQLRPIYRDQLRMYYDWTQERKLTRKIDASEYSEENLLIIIKEIDGKFRSQSN